MLFIPRIIHCEGQELCEKKNRKKNRKERKIKNIKDKEIKELNQLVGQSLTVEVTELKEKRGLPGDQG